jgi:hypothetical protein
LALVTNIVAADEDDFMAVGESPRPLDEWSGIEGQGLDTAKVTMLHCLVTGDEYDIALSLHEPVYVAETGAIVLRVADGVLDALAAQDDDTVAQLAEELAATEDFEMESWSTEDVHSLLMEFAGLARLAESQGQALFVWMLPEPA